MLDITQTLQDLGLNEKEIKIYLTLLPIGRAPASILGQKTGIQRSTAQYVCQQLNRKGLLHMEEKGNAFIYKPEPPKKLLYLLDQKIHSLKDKRNEVNEIIDEIKAKMDPHTSLPRTRFFEGKDEMRQLFQMILDLYKPLDTFEGQSEMSELMQDWYQQKLIDIRIERKIFNRVICPTTNKINVTSKAAYRDVRKIPVEEFPFTCEIAVCGDYVAIFSFKRETAAGILIIHEDIADNFRVIFNYLWHKLS